MTFDYFQFTPNLIRPIIPIILHSPTNFMLYSALIDSGADYCIFSLDIADLLQIKLKPQNKIKFVGVGKDKVAGYWGEITIRIGNISYQTEVIFAEISDFGHGILGQNGFFDHFDVRLSYKNQAIELNPL